MTLKDWQTLRFLEPLSSEPTDVSEFYLAGENTWRVLRIHREEKPRCIQSSIPSSQGKGHGSEIILDSSDHYSLLDTTEGSINNHQVEQKSMPDKHYLNF